MTLPLLEGLDGVQKMSKSLGNYIGVSEPAREIFGKVMSVSDELMWRYFSLVLALPDADVEAVRADVAAGRRHPRAVKDELGRRIAARFHGAEAARAAAEEFARVFSKKELPDEMTEIEMTRAEREEGAKIVALLVRAGCAASNGEARRLVQQGAVRIDNTRVSDPNAVVRLHAGAVIRAGKRGFVRIR